MSSRRQYLTQAELAEFADITIVDSDEADDQISQAEEIIDAYVGAQQKFLHCEVNGPVASATSTSFMLYVQQQNMYDVDYFKGCQVEIIGGTGAGQTRTISGSTRAGVCTISTSWTTTPDSTSFYKITQLGKFPRHKDVTFFSEVGTPTYYKSIPEAVKRATAAQVQFMIEMGDKYFSTDQSEKTSERIGDYAYTIGGPGTSTGAGPDKLIAPKAKKLLIGIKNRLGQILY